ncbi:hypothetical protein BDK51DRAFT_28490 [Blyttiomyces helicus]|uniref:Uncharacterized protein n=1 Tax=Blyttiomyces helicus TaxID=388810 RepID=A0A4P9WLV0_9FUNG|nr:hypothetical protein BDK51DRAFT_28490 [Blyttiomyces helicus]|eukprot:RKO93864.1 hypothetical protein BDK51DRAFT_28490 [Blyttiomyces helicus]
MFPKKEIPSVLIPPAFMIDDELLQDIPPRRSTELEPTLAESVGFTKNVEEAVPMDGILERDEKKHSPPDSAKQPLDVPVVFVVSQKGLGWILARKSTNFTEVMYSSCFPVICLDHSICFELLCLLHFLMKLMALDAVNLPEKTKVTLKQASKFTFKPPSMKNDFQIPLSAAKT